MRNPTAANYKKIGGCLVWICAWHLKFSLSEKSAESKIRAVDFSPSKLIQCTKIAPEIIFCALAAPNLALMNCFLGPL